MEITARKYAASLGVSHTAVNKAIKNHFIIKGYNKETKKIIPEIANQEWGFQHQQVNTPIELKEEGAIVLSNDISFTEARRINEILRAKLLYLEYEEEKKKLVNKEDINKQLFALGQQIKSALMSIPDRCIDNILASKGRADAHMLLTNELHNALEGFINTSTKGL